MRFTLSLMLCALALSCNSGDAVQHADPGRLDIFADFESEYIPSREVLVWLPEDYSTDVKYAVVYMHDGQMLFDDTTSWNGQTWNVDAVASALQRDGRCRPFIVVGINNHPTDRLTEYMPERALDYLPADDKLLAKFDPEKFIADSYLRFIVEELKPFVDSRYSTLTDAANTAIMGSSMGGLISLYALAEYPTTFGLAGCLSTHTPVAIDDVEREAPIWSQAFRDYLADNLPDVGSHRVYMDYGDQTLDAAYAPYQQAVDTLFESLGWGEANYKSLFFAGHSHSEASWQERLHVPLEWLLGR